MGERSNGGGGYHNHLDGKHERERIRELWNRYKYAVLVMLAGAMLLIWDFGNSGKESSAGSMGESSAMTEVTATAERTRQLQREMEEILSQISGVGEARVLLTPDTEGQLYLAENIEISYSGDAAAPDKYAKSSEIVLTDGGKGGQPITTRSQCPTWRGALVVCQGGENPQVKLTVTRAVAVLTGLPTDRVTVAKWR